MFFIMGISSGQKKLGFVQTILCNRCGSYGRYEVYVTYTYLSLFFIPVLKWNKKYYVKSTCCNSIYNIELELGKRIARGECTNINESDLNLVQKGVDRCPHCGAQVEENFKYCPACGQFVKSRNEL
ncbi:zinc ribbon family protein [Mobilisporobacter senegalensis]|uniref:Zinc ribbon family protein n=1 Tax=Mobilisporobacter senegalensis TaxID=1329262 RepID=A0A3N1XR28_9FIRM|nr:zinc ribbon domain-containing protein [Mobilisporobacter senegalensis]ROR28738.1 zinc ribbon family protein [Mobilisporobacter senegalensis]